MDVFEFVLVLVSIVIGLSMTELFAGSVRIVRGELSPYWLHALWLVQVFLFQVQAWWWLWIFREWMDWTFAWLVLVLIPPALLYVAATLIFPVRGRSVPLRDFYFESRKPFFLLLALLTASYVVIDWARFGVNPFPDTLRAVYVAAMCVLAFSAHPRVHGAVSVGAALGFVYWVSRFTPNVAVLDATP